MGKVLHELNQLEYGGVERIVHTIAKYDKTNEHTVMAYKDGPMRAEFEAIGVKVELVNQGTDEHRDFELDVIHIHTGGAASKLASDVQGLLPVIETIHSPVKSAVRREYARAKVGVSNHVTRRNPGAVTIYNGLDLDRYPVGNPSGCKAELREKFGIPQDALVIGRIGRVAPDKYLEEFLLACREVQKTVPDCHVVIAGQESSQPGYMGRAKLTAACLPVNNVHFLGFQEPKDVLPALDIFLYPSKDEGFGLVYAEAMLYGLTVVTYDTPLTKELFGGFVMLTGPTIKDLANGVLAAGKGSAVADYYFEKAPEFIRERYDGQRMAREYAELYAKVKAEVDQEGAGAECPVSPISSATA